MVSSTKHYGYFSNWAQFVGKSWKWPIKCREYDNAYFFALSDTFLTSLISFACFSLYCFSINKWERTTIDVRMLRFLLLATQTSRRLCERPQKWDYNKSSSRFCGSLARVCVRLCVYDDKLRLCSRPVKGGGGEGDIGFVSAWKTLHLLSNCCRTRWSRWRA